VCRLALSSGIRELLVEHRIPLSKVILELRKLRRLRHSIDIDHINIYPNSSIEPHHQKRY
jgi:hypothetical protein